MSELLELTRNVSSITGGAGAFQSGCVPAVFLWEAGLTSRLLQTPTADALTVELSFICSTPLLNPIPAAAREVLCSSV